MTLNMEVKKDALRQTQDGIWKLTVTVHPSDMPVDLMIAPMGTRYGLAMVVIEDEQCANNAQSSSSKSSNSSVSANNAHTQNEKSEGDKIRIRAVILCKDDLFRNYLRSIIYVTAKDEDGLYDTCKDFILRQCDIESRSELTTNKEAQEKFRQLDQKFKDWQFEQKYPDNLTRENM